MPSHTADPRHTHLVAVLPPLLTRSCPPRAGGFGGAWEVRLTRAETEDVGGLDLLRSAMRTAARSLGWTRVETYGIATLYGAVAGIVDRRPVPEEFAAAIERFREERMRAAVETVYRNRADGRQRAVPGSVFVTTQEFRAALAAR
ncbi:hypothetical protein GCM10010441_39310 [Kitasatospora paracochleata]|uniref:Uncharacterized protein n=1 Tax=Kitasatospora paracochleata TaxID=58354 RepID=A0ABT1J9X0_9ACTN|nr:hypothetical protein [Kitasatospora paracochleata]MCP2314247.1 hypothetical protein [Kitasatospora paracochleata]